MQCNYGLLPYEEALTKREKFSLKQRKGFLHSVIIATKGVSSSSGSSPYKKGDCEDNSSRRTNLNGLNDVALEGLFDGDNNWPTKNNGLLPKPRTTYKQDVHRHIADYASGGHCILSNITFSVGQIDQKLLLSSNRRDNKVLQ
ncbi:hypothetical protein FHG87_024685 [Trinorchestia longiramus]|nr:hypothetical protein FHG87_024685 [Trinorchestia longiramus]